MPINFNITSLKQKISQSVSGAVQDNEKLKQILGKVNQALPILRQTFKKYLPVIITILVLIIGLSVGKRIAFLSNQTVNIPKPASLPTTIVKPSDSNLTPLARSVKQFDPQLPDPLMPEFNDSILLQELED
jgi:hypothetical protein